MKTNLAHRAQISVLKLFIAAVALALVSVVTTKADVVFDNFSAYKSRNTDATANATGSTPNTFMGDGYVLATGTTAITGFDVFPFNWSGTAFNAIKINIFVWGTVNTGTVNVTTPLFGNLLGSYSQTSAGSYVSGLFYPIEGSSPGVTPGIVLTNPVTISSTTIGLTFNYQGSTDGGLTYASVNSLYSIISAGPAPTVGSLLFGNGYFRNANSETNGNFTSTIRSLGLSNQGLAVRVFGTFASAVNTSLTNLVFSVSGTNLNLSWPADHTGWRLLVQTNHLANGISKNTNDWGTVAGSVSTNRITVPMIHTNPTEFFRLAYP